MIDLGINAVIPGRRPWFCMVWFTDGAYVQCKLAGVPERDGRATLWLVVATWARPRRLPLATKRAESVALLADRLQEQQQRWER